MLGTLAHLALAYHYGSMMTPKPRFFIERDLRTALIQTAGALQKLVHPALQILLDYRSRYATDTWEPLHIEEEFAARLGDLDPGGRAPELDDEIVTCRPDLIVRTEDGRQWIVDHKTQNGGFGKGKDTLRTWSPENEYALNWQVLVNLHVVRQHMPIDGFIIQRIKRNEPFDVDRQVLRVPTQPYLAAPSVMRNLVATEFEVLASLAEGEMPLPSFHACSGKYGACDYRALCMASPASIPLEIQRLFRREV